MSSNCPIAARSPSLWGVAGWLGWPGAWLTGLPAVADRSAGLAGWSGCLAGPAGWLGWALALNATCRPYGNLVALRCSSQCCGRAVLNCGDLARSLRRPGMRTLRGLCGSSSFYIPNPLGNLSIVPEMASHTRAPPVQCWPAVGPPRLNFFFFCAGLPTLSWGCGGCGP